ncbi:MAG: lipid kinase YegS [Myxococcota bacterium]
MRSRIVLHGKQAQHEGLRRAITTLRGESHHVDVRLTWEGGDAAKLAHEAVALGFDRVIAGGGDGTVNEVLTGLVKANFTGTVGVLPLGTANDFARSAGIALDMESALRTALTAQGQQVDFGQVEDRLFLNVATGGFGTQITTQTDPMLKKALGGAAYFLTGVTHFSSIAPVDVEVLSPAGSWRGELLVLAIGNGRQAGGGNVLCPDAYIDDGLLDVAILPFLPEVPIHEALGELMSRGIEALEDVTIRLQAPWVEVRAHAPLTLNLDGEPHEAEHHRFEVVRRSLSLALPQNAPLLSAHV